MLTILYLCGNLIHVALIGWFVIVSLKTKPVWHWWIWFACVLGGLMSYETYREIMRLAGNSLVPGPYRLLYLNYLYFLLGVFYREVLFYAGH